VAEAMGADIGSETTSGWFFDNAQNPCEEVAVTVIMKNCGPSCGEAPAVNVPGVALDDLRNGSAMELPFVCQIVRCNKMIRWETGNFASRGSLTRAC
jgi:hypothetical protein